VSIYVDVDADDIVGLVQAGLLKAADPKNGRMVEGKSVIDFAEKYLSTHYIARRLRLATRSVRKNLAHLNIKPAAVFQSANRTEAYAWHKKDIEPHLRWCLQTAVGFTQALFRRFLCLVHTDSPLLKKSTHGENEKRGLFGPYRMALNLDR
jgi:hypothetical protein